VTWIASPTSLASSRKKVKTSKSMKQISHGKLYRTNLLNLIKSLPKLRVNNPITFIKSKKALVPLPMKMKFLMNWKSWKTKLMELVNNFVKLTIKEMLYMQKIDNARISLTKWRTTLKHLLQLKKFYSCHRSSKLCQGNLLTSTVNFRKCAMI